MRKTIFIVVDCLNPGGAERQCLLLTRVLKREWNPIVVAFSDGSISEQYGRAGIPVFFIARSSRFDFLSPLFKLSKLVKEYKPVILHSWGWMSAISCYVFAHISRTPHINSTVRMGTMPKNTKLLSRLAAKLGTYSVSNCNAGMNAWEVPKDKGVVIYNGFDWSRLGSEIPENSIKQHDFRVIMTASMSPKKDWNTFVSVARFITHKDKCISFFGFGDGVNRESLLSSASKLIRNKTMFLPGRIRDPISECMKANLGILLSTQGEGISNSIMEYMACGLPVICSNEGGSSELVVDKITGFLVDPQNDPKEIAEIILWLKNNPIKAKTIGLAGKERIFSQFSTQKMVQDYVLLYNKALAK